MNIQLNIVNPIEHCYGSKYGAMFSYNVMHVQDKPVVFQLIFQVLLPHSSELCRIQQENCSCVVQTCHCH